MKSHSVFFDLSLGCMASLVLIGSAIAQAGSAGVPAELLVRRSQPSVFQVLVYGSGVVTLPKMVTVKSDLLEREFAARPEGSKTDFFWNRIAADPEAYLEPSKETDALPFDGDAYASGTAFAVSREGILLTNSHLFSDPDASSQSSPEAVERLVAAPLYRFGADLVAQFGGYPLPETIDHIWNSIQIWYLSKVSVAGKFKEARVVLRYGVDDRKLKDDFAGAPAPSTGSSRIIPFDTEPVDPDTFHKKRPGPADMVAPGELAVRQIQKRLAGLPSKRPKPIPFTRRLRVLANGRSFPGEDVAVLQIVMDEAAPALPTNRGSRTEGGEVDRRATQMDRLICLPLGNSDLVLPGASIHALGFPGMAFDPASMDPSAQWQVSSRPGEIGQTKRTKGNWDAFEMTAEIDHGDSGGPVIDREGNVIGINVTGRPLDKEGKILMAGHKLAVPINIAKKYLKLAGVTPDRGSLGQNWDECLRLYNSGKFGEAFASLHYVHLMQEGVPLSPIGAMANQIEPGEWTFTSPYVEQMQLLLLAAKNAR